MQTDGIREEVTGHHIRQGVKRVENRPRLHSLKSAPGHHIKPLPLPPRDSSSELPEVTQATSKEVIASLHLSHTNRRLEISHAVVQTGNEMIVRMHHAMITIA